MNPQPHWHSHTEIKHWIKHALIPAVLIVAFLLLPKPWTLGLIEAIQSIELELIEALPMATEAHEVKPVEQAPLQPVIEKPVGITTEPPPQFEEVTDEPKPIQAPKTAPPPTRIIDDKPNTTADVSATDVLLMMKNRTSIDVPAEFQARTGPATDFYIPEQEIHDWLADIPFLDESVDKPKLQMRFYAEGIEGSIEKFFDKITISKTFTTKYGTKIHCALIGIIAACGWK